ncbi:hemophore-related protein [Mycobacterium vicinigordonae]|uniref:Hemophore-related protein n=1 Tax=Mycobacterium vicinigordonae TaxID=1719132 RepID=A0A7D6E1F7_9MYCO|nr:hemophore-related protein [Mycobacterium vicinigordonae]QLL06326.1 hemophore-related protein [Mycobacterium vicinigordonae]
MRLSVIGMGVAAGAAAVSLGFGAGIASADPLDAAINTTCNYGQVMAALNATDPAAAAQISASPIAVAKLNQFLSSGPQGRRQIAAQLSAMPGAQQYVNDLVVVADTCNNY